MSFNGFPGSGFNAFVSSGFNARGPFDVFSAVVGGHPTSTWDGNDGTEKSIWALDAEEGLLWAVDYSVSGAVGLDVDNSANVYATVFNPRSVRKYNASGLQVASIAPATAPGHIAAAPGGGCYVTKTNVSGTFGAIVKLDSSLNSVWAVGDVTHSFPRDVATDSSGNVYGAYKKVFLGSHIIYKVTPDGSESWSYTWSGVDNPDGIGVDEDGTAYAVSLVAGKGVIAIDSGGSLLWSNTSYGGRTVSASSDHVFIGDVTSLYALHRTGPSRGTLDWSITNFTSTFGVAHDGSGGVYVAGSWDADYNANVVRFNSSGSQIGSYSTFDPDTEPNSFTNARSVAVYGAR